MLSFHPAAHTHLREFINPLTWPECPEVWGGGETFINQHLPLLPVDMCWWDCDKSRQTIHLEHVCSLLDLYQLNVVYGIRQFDS